jgi:cytidine deaminase
MGQVAAALVTIDSNVYSGVCLDLGSGVGFCAEHSAAAAMVTSREYKIAAIVAVWRDDEGRLYVLPPCGRCREFISQIDVANLDCAVILGRDNVVKLREILPYNEFPVPLDE